MRKSLTVLAIFLFAGAMAYSQDIEKIAKDFEARVKSDTGIPYGRNNAVGKYYDIRGFKMYCEVYGEGQPLLVIHGNGGSIDNFIYQIPYFSKSYKVIIA